VRLALLHARIEILELGRYPTFVAPTLAFPALAFLFFVAPRADAGNANALMASYMAFGFLTVAFFEFGVGIAEERASPWDRYLRTLPAPTWTHLAGRIMASLVFATAPGVIVVILALTLTPVELSPGEWLALCATLAVGAVPFGLLGIALGYLISPKGALPTANLLFFALAYLGGLFTGLDGLPDSIRSVSIGLPTGQWSKLLASATTAEPLRPSAVIGLAGWAAAFAGLAAWAYRRNEGLQYR
jgi:ABC-2 type transport system permease protein